MVWRRASRGGVWKSNREVVSLLVRTCAQKADLRDEALLVDFTVRGGEFVGEELDEGADGSLGDGESQGGIGL